LSKPLLSVALTSAVFPELSEDPDFLPLITSSPTHGAYGKALTLTHSIIAFEILMITLLFYINLKLIAYMEVV